MPSIGFIGGLGPVEIGIWLVILLILAFLFWLIRRPVNQRINAVDERVDELEDRINELE